MWRHLMAENNNFLSVYKNNVVLQCNKTFQLEIAINYR